MRVAALMACLLLIGCGEPDDRARGCIKSADATDPLDRSGMVAIPAGLTRIGDERFYREEAPVREVAVDAFWIDRHAVTNAEFAAFVAATGYITLAERDGPEAGGGGVFSPGTDKRDPADVRQWWRFEPRANWRNPRGEPQAPAPPDDHPVVQIAYEDALAYARWRGRDLPSEAEWERAARGGMEGKAYAWGDDARPGGEYQANHWQGTFPYHDSGEDEHAGLAPVGCYPSNGYGLYDMAGNVWEWTRDGWGSEGFRIIKGGSFLCSDNYCHRYRPAARQPGDEAFSTEHLGFRTVWRGDGEGISPDQVAERDLDAVRQ